MRARALTAGLFRFPLTALRPLFVKAFPVPATGTTSSWPQNLALSPDGSQLLVPLNLADRAAIIDLDHSAPIRYVATGSGSYPVRRRDPPRGRTGVVRTKGPTRSR